MNENINNKYNRIQNIALASFVGTTMLYLGVAYCLYFGQLPIQSTNIHITESTDNVETREMAKEILDLKKEQELLKARIDKYQRSTTKIGFYSMQTIRHLLFDIFKYK